ncbi:MAG: hypothetical protein M0P94_04385, partial [Candidatus Absconditabacterales bacterium]|nr:hypothetical protein [Candidatus Absconditabacterales bacterium]
WKVDYDDSIPIYDELKDRSVPFQFGGLDYLFEGKLLRSIYKSLGNFLKILLIIFLGKNTLQGI